MIGMWGCMTVCLELEPAALESRWGWCSPLFWSLLFTPDFTHNTSYCHLQKFSSETAIVGGVWGGWAHIQGGHQGLCGRVWAQPPPLKCQWNKGDDCRFSHEGIPHHAGEHSLRVGTETVRSHKFIQTINVSGKTTVIPCTRRAKVSSVCWFWSEQTAAQDL